MQNIERNILEKVRETGNAMTAADFRWHNGHPWIPPPKDGIQLEATVQARRFKTFLSSEQVRDSASTIRRDVAAMIRDAVRTLTQ